MKFLFMFLLALPACAQCGQGSDLRPCQVVLNYNGSNQITSQCFALSVETFNRPTTSIAISAATQASPVVFTSTGHGFALGARPSVTIKGGTGNWVAVNGTFPATVVNANSISIAVDSSGFGALTGTLTFTTTAPRLTVAEWAVKLFSYDGSGNIINTAWLGGSTALRNLCSGSALTAGNSQ